MDRLAYNRWLHNPTAENWQLFLDACDKLSINPLTWIFGNPNDETFQSRQ